jgi:hypothetical protein
MTDHVKRAERPAGDSPHRQQRTHPRSTDHLFLFRHSHGGTGCGSAHTITAQTARQTRPDSTGLLGCADHYRFAGFRRRALKVGQLRVSTFIHSGLDNYRKMGE